MGYFELEKGYLVCMVELRVYDFTKLAYVKGMLDAFEKVYGWIYVVDPCRCRFSIAFDDAEEQRIRWSGLLEGLRLAGISYELTGRSGNGTEEA